MSVVLSNFEHEASQTIKAMDRPGTQRSVSWVRVRFLQRAHVLANEAAARAGRGQAIAPTMLRAGRQVVHSRGDGLSSPRSPRKNRTRTPYASWTGRNW